MHRLLIAGVGTWSSVMRTVLSAADRGIACTVVEDCCADESFGHHDAAIRFLTTCDACDVMLSCVPPQDLPARSHASIHSRRDRCARARIYSHFVGVSVRVFVDVGVRTFVGQKSQQSILTHGAQAHSRYWAVLRHPAHARRYEPGSTGWSRQYLRG